MQNQTNTYSEWRLKRTAFIAKHNVRIKSSARSDHHPPWHKLKDDDATDAQLQQWWRDPAWHTRFWFWCDVWGRQDQCCVFCTPSLTVCSTRCSQPGLNLEATVAAKWTLAFLVPGTPQQGKHFDDVNLRHHYSVLCKLWWCFYNFSII